MSNTARGLQSQRNEVERIDEAGLKIFRVSGRVQVIGDGESSVNVTFPIIFAERPGFSFGFELAKGQLPAAGRFPTVSCGVFQWDSGEFAVTGVPRYFGATLMVVTTGNPRYLYVHWHMEGRAFNNPITNVDTIDGQQPF